MLVFFENQASRAFANHEAVTVLVVSGRSKFRVIVAGAGRKKRVEHGRLGRAQFLGTAGNHHVLLAVLDQFVSLADSEAAAGACSIRSHQAARKAEKDADVHGTSLRHGADVACRRNARAVVCVDHREKVDEGIDVAHRATVSHAHAAGLHQGRIFGKTGALNSLVCGKQTHHGNTASAADLFTRVLRQRLQNRGCKASIHLLVDIPRIHAHDTVLERFQIFNSLIRIETKRRDTGTTRNNNTAHYARPPFTEMTWRVI